MNIQIITFFSVITPLNVQNSIIGKLKNKKIQIKQFKPGFTVINHHFKSNDLIFLFIGSGGTEDQVKQFMDHNLLSLPILLLSYNENNSLPAALEIRAFLDILKNKPTKIIHSKNLDLLQQKLQRWSRVVETLQNSTIGIIGKPSYWLIASQVNMSKVKDLWGTKIQKIPIKQLVTALRSKKTSDSELSASSFIEKSSKQDVTQETVRDAIEVTKQIIQLVKRYSLDAVTLQCFKLLEATNITGCHALSHLNDIGIPAGCEGDIPATFTMFLIKLLTNKSSFMANVADLNFKDNTVTFAHCTVGTELTKEYHINTHFETQKSLGIKGVLDKTIVTVIKVFGDTLDKYWVSKGQIIRNLNSDHACRTQIEVCLEKSVKYFVDNSLANHHIIVFGDERRVLEDFLDIFAIHV